MSFEQENSTVCEQPCRQTNKYRHYVITDHQTILLDDNIELLRPRLTYTYRPMSTVKSLSPREMKRKTTNGLNGLNANGLPTRKRG